MGLLTRIKAAAAALTKAEGQAHGPPYILPVTGGVLGEWGQSINWSQQGYLPPSSTVPSAIVAGCVGAYAQTVATAAVPSTGAQIDKGGRDPRHQTWR